LGERRVHHDASFVDMYRLLNLEPGCDLAQFKQAYRRRVAVLHPDRAGVCDEVSSRSEQLTQLTRLYTAALTFERRHGRLPGAPIARPSSHAPSEPAMTRAPDASAKRTLSRWPLILLIALLIALTLAWNADWFSGDTDGDSSTAPSSLTATSNAHRPTVTTPARLNIGMDSDSVRRVQGDPVLVKGYRWDYGPSWVLFENGAVVDWYSSPLQPLETATSRPRPAAR
jgi:hypothetical protein